MKKHPKLLNVRKEDGYGPLHLACLHDNYSVLKFLLQQVCTWYRYVRMYVCSVSVLAVSAGREQFGYVKHRGTLICSEGDFKLAYTISVCGVCPTITCLEN